VSEHSVLGERQVPSVSDGTASSSGIYRAVGPKTLRQIRFFQQLPDAIVSEMINLVKVRRVEKGDVLSLDDQLAHRMCFALSGRYRLGVITPSGTTITVHQIEPGDHFGERWIYAERRLGNYQLIADCGGMLIEMQACDVTRLAEAVPEFSRELMRSLANMATDYAVRVYEFASLDVYGRLRAELLRLAGPGAALDRVLIDPAPTHATIASQIGSTREGVTRNLSRMVSKGLIRTERGRIEILSVKRLRQEVDQDLGG
jgi:CRP-like cAMP-binding protein